MTIFVSKEDIHLFTNFPSVCDQKMNMLMLTTFISNGGIPLQPKLPTNRHLEFVEVREILCPFVMFYDSVMTQIQQSYKCLADSPGFG